MQAVNDWLQSGDGPTGLLVCSRIEEYGLYETNLGLNAAVCLEPLTDAQLQAYLASLERQDLWETLCQDADLLALIRTPLLLSVAILAKDCIDSDQWQRKKTTTARKEYLLEAYVDNQLHKIINRKEYPLHIQPAPHQIRKWLAWLAGYLNTQSQDEFLIDNLQPEGLGNKRREWLYWLFLFLGNSLIACLFFTFHFLPEMVKIGPFSWRAAINIFFLIGIPASFVLSTQSKNDGANLLAYIFFLPFRMVRHSLEHKTNSKDNPPIHRINFKFRLRRRLPSLEEFSRGFRIAWHESSFINYIPLASIPGIAIIIIGIHEMLIAISGAIRLRKIHVTSKRFFRNIHN